MPPFSLPLPFTSRAIPVHSHPARSSQEEDLRIIFDGGRGGGKSWKQSLEYRDPGVEGAFDRIRSRLFFCTDWDNKVLRNRTLDRTVNKTFSKRAAHYLGLVGLSVVRAMTLVIQLGFPIAFAFLLVWIPYCY